MAKFPPLTLKKVIFDNVEEMESVVITFSIEPVFVSTQPPSCPKIVTAFDTFRERFEKINV